MAKRDEKTTVTGLLKIEIPEPAVTLTLLFEPSPDGDAWDPQRLEAALHERGVRDGYTTDDLADFLRSAARDSGKGPFSRELLRGVPPRPARPDTVEWDDFPEEPEEYAAMRDKVLASRSGPEIYRKERVFVDPKVLQTAYVPASHVLGTIVPGEPGIPGKDIFGRLIPVKQLADSSFYHGSNIAKHKAGKQHAAKEGETFISETAGFLRIGRNWADITPFEPHRWNVEISPDKATCYLELTPGHADAPPPDPQKIRERAVELSYPEESLMSPEDLEDLMRGQIETGNAARLPITLNRDSSFDIVVGDDKLAAYLNVYKGVGRGKPLKLKEIGRAIKESGLVRLDLKKISTDMTAFYEGPEFAMTGYLLCEGTPAIPGPERQVEFVPVFNDDKRTAEIKKQLVGIDSFPSLQEFPAESVTRTAPVESEQLICSIDPPSPGEPGRDIYGKSIPAEPGKAPQIVLHENLVERKNVIASTEAGILDYGEIDGTIHLRVRPHVDAVINVLVSDNRMQAFLSMTEGLGSGRHLDVPSIEASLKAKGVVHGIDSDRITRALEAARAGEPVDHVVVAEGTPPVDQVENRLEFLIDITGDPGVRIRKDGSADFKNRNTIHIVTKGQALCRILPSPQKPVDGTDVTGKTVPAQRDSGLELELGENVIREESADGSILIKSATDGEALFTRNRIAVQIIHTIKGDVDMKVGNIKFPGTVIVGGTVRTGFYIISGGEIKVAGGVEGALLSSDGNIIVKQGVKGAGKAVLRSKQGIMSSFVELATLLSVGDITLKSAVVRSRIKCNGKITFQGDKGRILGGQIRARNGLEVTSVGSPRGIRTQLSFGQDYLIADLIEKEEKEIEKVKQRITEVDFSMRKLEKAGTNVEGLQRLRQEKVQLLKLMEKRGLRLFTLRERFEQHFPSKIIITGEVHPGTVFESHGRMYEITALRKSVAVEFNAQTGNIDVSDLKNQE